MTTKSKAVPQLRFPEFEGDWSDSPIIDKLEKVIDYRGKGPPKADTGIPLITARNVRDGYLDFSADEYIDSKQYDKWMSRGIPKANDVLFTTEAPLGNVALFPMHGKYALGQRIITLQANSKECYSIFLFHLLRSVTAQVLISQRSTGTTAKGIKSKVFVKIVFHFPTLAEQQKIADFLTAVDRRLEQLREKKALLEDYKKGVMQQLFTQTLRFKDDNGNDFPDWEEKKLGELLTFKNGFNAEKKHYGSGIKFINVLDVLSSSPIVYNKIIGSVEIPAKDLHKFEVQYGDLLFQRSSETREEVGQANVYLDRFRSAGFGGFVIRGKAKVEFNPKYMNYLLRSPRARNEITKKSGGSTRYNVSQETLSDAKIQVSSSIPEQTKIANFLSTIDRKIESVSEQIDQTQTFKKGLLQQMFV